MLKYILLKIVSGFLTIQLRFHFRHSNTPACYRPQKKKKIPQPSQDFWKSLPPDVMAEWVPVGGSGSKPQLTLPWRAKHLGIRTQNAL